MTTPNWTVVATEDDPARAEWTRAAQDADVAGPRFVSWSAVVDSEAEFQPGEVVFAERLYPCVAENPVRGQRARYVELQAALSQLDAALAKAGAISATPAEPALLALDRTRCAAFLRESGVPVLQASDVSSVRDNVLRPRYAGSDDWTIDCWRTRLFRHRTRSGGFEVRRGFGQAARGKPELAEVVALLTDDGIHAVESLHRVYLGFHFCDIRLAVVDGKVTHAAGVTREEEILREWYGGKRQEIDQFLERFGIERWERLVALAERTATFFPGIRSLGVDLIMDNDTSEYVADVNPFGAYLPGLIVAPPNVEREHMTVRDAVLRSLSADS
jgi:hypothetical protein